MAQGLFSRRRALQHLGLLMGTAAGQSFLASWLAPDLLAAQAEPHHLHSIAPAAPAAYAPQFFKPQEFRNLEILTEMIIPRDEKPGAQDARVADYIDFLTFSAAEFEPEMQKAWVKGMALLERLSHDQHGKAFAELSQEQRHALLTAMSLPEIDPQAHHDGYEFFLLVKGATVEGFYSSRIGLLEVLEYKGLSFLTSFPGCTHPEHQT